MDFWLNISIFEAITTSLALPSVETQPHYTPLWPNAVDAVAVSGHVADPATRG